MQDQVAALDEVGVRAAFLNSTLSSAEAAAVERRLRAGELDLLYVAPERLLTERCQRLLDDLQRSPGLALFAIDEAHCVSQWGHDFRPEYGQLAILRERFSAVPRIALTATADVPTREEIAARLLVEPRIFVASFDRPNIRYRVIEKRDARAQLLRSSSTNMAAKRASCTRWRATQSMRSRCSSPRTTCRRCRITPAWTVRPAPPPAPLPA